MHCTEEMELYIVDNSEVPLQTLLSIERDKRIAAELLAEKEHQALLQLKNILLKKAKDDEKKETKDKAAVKRTVSNTSVGQLPRAFSQEFTASVLGDLPSPVQQSLDLQTLGLDTSDKTHFSRAIVAINCYDDRTLLHVLKEKGANELLTEHGIRLLTAAAEQGSTGCLRVLLQSGCNPNHYTPQNPVPIFQVAKNGNLSVLQLLIEYNADINVTDRLGYCPLYLALQGGRKELVETILDANPKMDIMTGYDNSIIHAAVLQDNHILLRMTVVKLRESYDKETIFHVLNKQNEDGYTPLHQATAEGYKRCVEVLCACSEVDVTITDYKGRTAFNMASPDCQIIIENKMFKEVSIVIETGEETAQPKLIVGVVRVMPHHKWNDLNISVHEIMYHFVSIMKGGIGIGLMRDRDFPTYPINILQTKIPTELMQAIHTSEDILYDDLTAVLNNRSKTLDNFDIHLGQMNASLIGKYSLVEEVELENRTGCHADGDSNRNTPYKIIELIEQVGEPLEIIVDLSDGVNNMAMRSLIPDTILEKYTQLTARNKLIMIHGPQEIDLSFLTYNLMECIELTSTEQFKEIHLHIHSKFTRDDLLCALHDNHLLEHIGEVHDKTTNSDNDSIPCVLIMDGASKQSDYDLFEDINILMATQSNGRGVWLSLSDQSTVSSFVSGKYKMRNVSHYIVTRVINKSVSLPSGVMDAYAHIWLGDMEEPILGQILRTLLCQMIHVRKGHSFSKYDSLYQVIVWVWQFWVLYNHFVDQFDLHDLKIGPKLFLNCPVKSNDPDAVYNWFVELWNYHLVPKIRDVIIDPSFKPKSRKISRSETVRVLLLFLSQRIIQLTCPLYPEATYTLMKNLEGVGELQNLSYPLDRSYDQTGGTPKTNKSPKLKSSSTFKSNGFSGSPKLLYKSTGNLSEELGISPPSITKESTPQKQVHRPKSGGLFGRTSTLRKTLFKGSRTSLYAVEEEDKNKKKSAKSKKETQLQETNNNGGNGGSEDQQEMEDFFNQLMTSKSSRMDEQRSVMSPSFVPVSQSLPTHHTISVSPSESSHDSIEITSPTQSNYPKKYFQSLSDKDKWISNESIGRDYVNTESSSRPKLLSVVRQSRSRSKSEENVFSLNQRRASLEDILRPTSEVTLSIHEHEMSNSSELLSESHSSIDTSTTSMSYHESVPSYSGTNSNVIEELSQENEEDRKQNGCHESVVSSTSITSSLSDIIKQDVQSLSYYSATLGLDPSMLRRTSSPAVFNVIEGGVGNRRRLSSPPTMMTWNETVEM